jgi:O-antigen ligase
MLSAMAVDSAPRFGLGLRHRPILTVLILLSLAVNLVYPGEVFFESKFLLISISILAFLITFTLEYRSGQSRSAMRLIQIVFLPLLFLIPSVIQTINASHSQDTFILFFSYFCLFAALQFLRLEFSSLFLSLLALSFVAFWIDLFCLHQYFFGLSDLRAIVMHSSTLDEKLKAGVLARIATGRVFANFALPNTLAGFLSIMLPLNFFLLTSALRSEDSSQKFSGLNRILFRNRLIASILVVQFCLSLVVLGLTQSFGGGVCCCAAFGFVACWAAVTRKIPVKLSVAVLLVASVGAAGWLAWVTYKRGFRLWNLEASENPITLRWNNYKTALRIFRDFPVRGVGLGNYGTINPRYQTVPQTVAQYAHNTFLQLLSEAGIFWLASLLAVSITLIKCRRRPPEPVFATRGPRSFCNICLGASLLTWAIHNLLDIDLYFPSLGGLGVFLCGIYFSVTAPRWGDIGDEVPSNSPGRYRLTTALVFGGTLLICFLVARAYLAEAFCSLGIDYAETKDFERAEHFIEKAVTIQGNDASKIILQSRFRYLNARLKGQDRRDQLLALRDAYDKAARLDPYNANYQYEFSRILFALGETELALHSRNRAIELFPSEPKFRQDLVHALEPKHSF